MKPAIRTPRLTVRRRVTGLFAALGACASLATLAGGPDVAEAARGAAFGPGVAKTPAAQSTRKATRAARRVARRRARGPVARSTIVNGYVPHPSQWPWMTALVARGGTKSFCGGTLLKPTLVLTAAHCLTDENGIQDVQAGALQVILGRRVLSDASTGERIDIASITIHPSYRNYRQGHDLAVVRLARPSSQSPAALGDSQTWGDQASAMGWGDTYGGSRGGSDQLLAADLPLHGDATCDSYYGSTYVPSMMLCAGGAGSGTCNGDSGGPLMVASGGRWKLVGVMSFGFNGCPTDKPRVMAWASGPTLRGWIVEQMAAADVPPPAPAPQPAAPPAPPADTTGPVISTLKLKAGSRGASLSRAARPSVSLHLSEVATVKLTVQRCRRASRRQVCRALRTLTHGGQAGVNQVRLASLPRGSYRLVAQATDGSGNRSLPRSVRFRVAR